MKFKVYVIGFINYILDVIEIINDFDLMIFILKYIIK